MLKTPVDARVAVNPHGQSVKPVTVPDQVNSDASSVPTYVMAKGAGCPPAKVTLTDSVRGLETLPVPEANPSAVSLTVAVTVVRSWTMSIASGLREIPEKVTFQRPVTVRIDTGSVVGRRLPCCR